MSILTRFFVPFSGKRIIIKFTSGLSFWFFGRFYPQANSTETSRTKVHVIRNNSLKKFIFNNPSFTASFSIFSEQLSELQHLVALQKNFKSPHTHEKVENPSWRCISICVTRGIPSIFHFIFYIYFIYNDSTIITK